MTAGLKRGNDRRSSRRGRSPGTRRWGGASRRWPRSGPIRRCMPPACSRTCATCAPPSSAGSSAGIRATPMSRRAAAPSARSSLRCSSCSSCSARAARRCTPATPSRLWWPWKGRGCCRRRSGRGSRSITASSAPSSIDSRCCTTCRSGLCRTIRTSSGSWRSGWASPRPKPAASWRSTARAPARSSASPAASSTGSPRAGSPPPTRCG